MVVRLRSAPTDRDGVLGLGIFATEIAVLFFASGGIFASELPAWLGWLTLAADAGFVVYYLVMRDIPPFFFYLLLLTVGIGLL